MNKVLVTGGAGFIGSLLSKRLVRAGKKVRILDQLYFGKQQLNPIRDRIELIKGNIIKPPKSVFKDIDAVIHLAGFSNDPMANFAPELNFKVNTEATRNLALLAKEAKVKRFIFASSCSIYNKGVNNLHPYTESSKVSPKEHYSRSKYLAEQSILPLNSSDFEVVILRKGTVVGYSPRMRFDLVVNTMVKTAFQGRKLIVYDGTQYRPLIDINDVVSAYLLVLEAPAVKVSGQIFNLLRKNYKILELAKRVLHSLSNTFGKELPIEMHPEIKDRTYQVSGEKFVRELGFKSKYSMSQSVAGLVNFINKRKPINFNDPKYYNIETMKKFMKSEAE